MTQPVPHDIQPFSLLADYLDAEPRPSFISHLSESGTDLVLDHTNTALRSHELAYKLVLDGHDQKSSAPTELLDLLASNEERVRTNQDGNSVLFSKRRWSPTVVGGHWVVMTTIDEVSALDGLRSKEVHQNGQVQETKPGPDSNSALEDRSETSQNVGRSVLARNISLGTAYPHGHLGDREYLEWVRQQDWASTSYGPIELWPNEIWQACQMVLATPDPSCIMWGNDLKMFYNSSYSVIIGEERHPKAFGRPFEENWREVAPVYKKLYGKMKHNGQPIKHEDVSRLLVRHGHPEHIYANLTMSPIVAATGPVIAMWVSVHETTRQVVSEKRITNLTNISNRLAKSTTLPDLWDSLVDMLDQCNDDIQFAAAYRMEQVSQKSNNATLHTVVGMQEKGGRHPDLNTAIHACFATGMPIVLSLANNNLYEGLLENLQANGIQDSCREMILQPLRCNINDQVEAVIFIGFNPFRKFDRDLRSFVQLLTTQVESSIAVIRTMEREKARFEQQFANKMDKRFWNFAEKAPIGIYTYDQEGSMTYCNKAFEILVGTTKAALAKPMGWTEVVHPDCVQHVKSVWNKLVRMEDHPTSFDIDFIKPWAPHGKDQFLDRTSCLATSYPEVTEEGKVIGVIGCVVDVSSLKWVEGIQSERLTEALELKRQQGNFFDVMSHELSMLQASFDCFMANDIIGNPLGAIVHSAHELVDQLTGLDIASSPEHNETLAHLLELATTIVYCGNHQKRILDDVLTLSKLDSKLIEIFPISTNPAKLLKEVAAIFSSELRNSGINLEIIVGAQYQKLDVKAVMIDAHRVTQIIVNLLSNAIKFIKDQPQRHISLSVDAFLAEDEKDSRVRYVSSGTYHRDPTHDVEWGTGEPLYLAFSIHDTGPGMTESESFRLFQQFSQASPRTHAQYGGSGLGLFISRELTEMHGGQIGLSSEQGSGSRFSFYVKTRHDITDKMIGSPVIKAALYPSIQGLTVSTPPYQDSKSVPANTPQSQQNEIGPAPFSDGMVPVKRVLLVEDNLINQRLLKKLLKRHNYDVDIANNGEEALAIIAGSKWNITLQGDDLPELSIVLSDIEMPVMDGKMCVRRIRQLQREGLLQQEIPVLAITSNAQKEKIEEAKGCGFDAVVTKPYDIRELLQTVHEYSTKFDSVDQT